MQYVELCAMVSLYFVLTGKLSRKCFAKTHEFGSSFQFLTVAAPRNNRTTATLIEPTSRFVFFYNH